MEVRTGQCKNETKTEDRKEEVGFRTLIEINEEMEGGGEREERMEEGREGGGRRERERERLLFLHRGEGEVRGLTM